MKIIKRKRRRSAPKRDGDKERTYRRLAEIFADSGYQVRREKLKQGHGWRVASGACRMGSERLVFVDSRLSQSDQIAFLVARILELRIEVSEEAIADLPKSIRSSLSEALADAA